MIIQIPYFLWMIIFFGYVNSFYSTLKDFEILADRHKLQNVSIRVRRQAPIDKMKQFLDHASIIARIANGISLQSGLMNGSIPIDTAVGELLSFGDVKVSDIIQFKPENMNSLAEKLKGLPKTLDSSVKDLENSALRWNELRKKSESVGDDASLPKKDAYFKELEDLNSNYDFSPLNDPRPKLDELVANLEYIETLNINDNTVEEDKRLAFTRGFVNLPSFLDGTIKELEKLISMKDGLSKYQVLIDGEKMFAPIGSIIKLMLERQKQVHISTSSQRAIIQKNFQQLDDLNTMFKENSNGLIVLKKFFENRVKKRLKVLDIKQLSKDVQNPWMEEITEKKVSLEKIKSGLQPLIAFQEKIAQIETKLGSLDDLNSFIYFEKLQKDLSIAPKDSSKLAKVFKDIDECAEIAINVLEGHYKPSQEVVAKIEKFGPALSKFAKSIKLVDPVKLKFEMDAFMKFLNFKDIDNLKESVNEIVGVMKQIKTTGNFKKFKKLIDDVAGGLKIDPTTLKNEITEAINGKGDIEFHGLPEEIKVFKCLRSHKENSEKVVTAISVTQPLRNADSNKIGVVGTVATGIASVSEDLKAVTTEKLETNPDATEINSMPNSSITSDIIQVSVTSLRNAYSLKSLKQEILDLKSVEPLVTKAIGTIKDKNAQKSITDNWGDHPKDIIELESGIGEIAAISDNLQEPKTLKDYGNPFPELSKISDIKIDSSKKIQALDTLIPLVQDPTEFEKNKKTLEKIDSLDLGFVRHSSKLTSAKSAFNSLFNFLAQFSLAPVTKAPPAQQGPSGTGPAGYGPNNSPYGVQKEKTDYGLIVEVSAGVIGVLILIAVGSFYYHKHHPKKVNKKSLTKWIRAQYFEKDDYASAYRYHESCMKTMEIHAGRPDKKASFDYLPIKKHRSDIRFCNPETAIHHIKKDGKKMPIHANIIESGNGVKFYATQSPTPKTDSTDDTREDFWHMCMHDSVEDIVMLNSVLPVEYYYPEGNNTEKYGRYEVKSLSQMCHVDFRDVFISTLEVKDTSGKYHKRVIMHYQYVGWPDMNCPKDGNVKQALAIMKLVEGNKTPIVVHCLAGIGRTMSFIGLHTVSENVKKDPEVTIANELSKLRARRWHGIQTLRQCYWLQVAVAHKLNEDFELGLDDELKEMFELFHAVACKDKGTPEFEAEIKKRKEEGIAQFRTKNLGEVIIY